MNLPQPIAYCVYEGGTYEPFVPVAVRFGSRDEDGYAHKRNREYAHAIFFDDGSAFDMVNGWRHGPDAEALKRVREALAGDELRD